MLYLLTLSEVHRKDGNVWTNLSLLEEERARRCWILRSAIAQSCDTYFYEMSRRLGVDRLKVGIKIWFG